MDPSTLNDEIIELRRRVKIRLNMEADRILREEVDNVLGRVKILVEVGLRDGQYAWTVETQKKENP